MRTSLVLAILLVGCMGRLSASPGDDRGPQPPGVTPDPGQPDPGQPDPGTPEAPRLVDGASIGTVEAAQTLVVTLDGAPPAVPLITNKAVTLRVGVNATDAWGGGALDVVATVVDDLMRTEARASVELSPGADATAVLTLPAASITEGASVRLQLVTGAGDVPSQPGHAAQWPTETESRPLLAQPSPRMRVVLVRVRHEPSVALGTGRGEVTLDEARLGHLRAAILAMYPVSDDALELSVRPAVHSTQQPAVFRSDDDYYLLNLLDEIYALHASDGAPLDAMYYGVTDYDDTRWPCEGCPAGVAGLQTEAELMAREHTSLAGVGLMSPTTRPGSFLDDYSAEELAEWAALEMTPPEVMRANTPDREDTEHEILLHELGHTLGADHAPCTLDPQTDNYPDATFPRMDGSIGLPGYDARHDRFLPANYMRDFMSYCFVLWISEHNYARFRRSLGYLESHGRASTSIAPHLLIRVRSGRPEVAAELTAPPAAPDASAQVRAFDENDAEIARGGAHVFYVSEGGAMRAMIPASDGAVRYELTLDDGTTLEVAR